MAPMDIDSSVLWLGAHKTGTTFLQETLTLSRDALEKNNVHYMDLDEFRERYTRPLIYRRHYGPPQPINSKVNLIFDENIPNLVQHALSKKGLYPDLVTNSMKISKYFGLKNPDIYFGIRNYAGFIPSLYCEVLKSTPFKIFRQFYNSNIHVADWSDVAQRLHTAFPESIIYIYLYENLRGNEGKLLSQATKVPASDFNIPSKISRPGFSNAAVGILDEIAQDRMVTRNDVTLAIKKFPKSKKYTSFQPFSEEELKNLTEKYQNHIRDLANLKYVKIIDLS
jgi:hypothetical protein